MFLCEEDPVSVLHMDTDTAVSLNCANKTDRSVDVFLLAYGQMVRYATLLPESSLKARGRFPNPMVFRDAETEEVMWVRRRYIAGEQTRTGEKCYHFVVYVTKGVLPLEELAMKSILGFIKDRGDIESLELPETLKERLGKMVDRRVHFFNFFTLKLNTITDVPKTNNCIMYACNVTPAFGLRMGPFP